MNKISLLVISSVFLLTGCGLFGGGEDNTSVTPIPPENPTPPPTPEATETPDTTDNNQGVITTGGLIPGTNSQDRLRQIEQGRNNPFNSISPPAVIRVREDQTIPFAQLDRAIVRTPAPTAEIASIQGVAGSNGVVNVPGQPPKPNLALDVASSGAFCKRTLQEGGRFSVAGISAPPSPNEANAVLVSGIINIGGQHLALIKMPNENSFRRVGIGESLMTSGGTVSVTNIEVFPQGPQALVASSSGIADTALGALNGYVTFTQYGQNVVRRVGEPSLAPETKDEPAEKGFTIITPEGPSIFGISRGLLLTSVNVNAKPTIIPEGENLDNARGGQERVGISGTLCNDNPFTIRVSSLDIQIEDSQGLVLSSSGVTLDGSFVLKPGQQGVFDGGIRVRGRLTGNINVKLRSWGGGKYQEQTW